MTTELLLGIAGTIIGLGVLILHCAAPEKLGKLLAFQNLYGKTPGKIMHIVFYGIVPLAVGVLCLYKSFIH